MPLINVDFMEGLLEPEGTFRAPARDACTHACKSVQWVSCWSVQRGTNCCLRAKQRIRWGHVQGSRLRFLLNLAGEPEIFR